MEQPADDPRLAALCSKIERDRGFYCSSYKHSCLRRRISARMRVKDAATFDQYSSILDGDPLEYDRLISALTINVSRFFRNPETYACIAAKVLPEIWERSGPLIKVWSAGCALGEEAYSLAVLCHQHAEHHPWAARDVTFDIVGTDVDARAISAARRGRYPAAAFADTVPAVRDLYFPLTDGLYHVAPGLRRMVSFHTADLLETSREPARAHLILCPNDGIYFTRETQERLFERFHNALLPGGYLVLGKVETLLGRTREMFAPVSSRERIYRRV